MSDEDQDLNEINQYQTRPLELQDTYQLGINLTHLRWSSRYQHKIGGAGEGGIIDALNGIETILKITETSERVSKQIEDFIENIEAEHSQDSPETEIKSSLANDLSEKTEVWSQLIYEAIRDENRIKVPNSGLINLSQLVDNPSTLFPKQN